MYPIAKGRAGGVARTSPGVTQSAVKDCLLSDHSPMDVYIRTNGKFLDKQSILTTQRCKSC